MCSTNKITIFVHVLGVHTKNIYTDLRLLWEYIEKISEHINLKHFHFNDYYK